MSKLFLFGLFGAACFGQELTVAEKQFQAQMTNVVMAGYYTQGDKAELREDRYVIERISKLKDDVWKFEARVQYNKKDMKIAINVPVKFAGETPVITLTNYAVPGFGTFSARVVFYDGGYAGMWGGEKSGGKMFGKITKVEAVAEAK